MLFGGAPPERLYLSIIPEYVPKTHGTFLVNAQVNAPATRPVQIRCAVHYVDMGDGVRYRVCPEGTALNVPSETTLSDHAEAQNWAKAEKELTPTPGGAPARKLALPIHIGPWPTAEIDWSARSRVRSAHRSPTEPLPGNPRMGVKTEIQQAAEMLRKVPETARIDGPEGLRPILESGRFEVTGTVYFRPLQPFDPNPEIPGGSGPMEEAADTAQQNEFMSLTDIEYSYPADKQG